MQSPIKIWNIKLWCECLKKIFTRINIKILEHQQIILVRFENKTETKPHCSWHVDAYGVLIIKSSLWSPFTSPFAKVQPRLQYLCFQIEKLFLEKSFFLNIKRQQNIDYIFTGDSDWRFNVSFTLTIAIINKNSALVFNY